MNEIDRRFALTAGLTVALAGTGSAAAASLQVDLKPVFDRFVTAQNAHDAAAVEAMLWNSPSFLLITGGTTIWGRDAAMERFRALYQGTWSLAPDMTQFRAVALGDAAAQLYVPILFSIGAPGQQAQPARVLMNQTLLRISNKWQIASILPVLASMP